MFYWLKLSIIKNMLYHVFVNLTIFLYLFNKYLLHIYNTPGTEKALRIQTQIE